MRRRLITLFTLFFLIHGCASVQPVQKGNLTAGMVKTTIIKGETIQNDILEVFGAPNIITKNKSGDEVWTYEKMSVESGSSEVFGTVIIVSGKGSRTSSSSRTFTLMIEFDDNDVVKDYSYRTSSF